MLYSYKGRIIKLEPISLKYLPKSVKDELEPVKSKETKVPKEFEESKNNIQPVKKSNRVSRGRSRKAAN